MCVYAGVHVSHLNIVSPRRLSPVGLSFFSNAFGQKYSLYLSPELKTQNAFTHLACLHTTQQMSLEYVLMIEFSKRRKRHVNIDVPHGRCLISRVGKYVYILFCNQPSLRIEPTILMYIVRRACFNTNDTLQLNKRTRSNAIAVCRFQI